MERRAVLPLVLHVFVHFMFPFLFLLFHLFFKVPESPVSTPLWRWCKYPARHHSTASLRIHSSRLQNSCLNKKFFSASVRLAIETKKVNSAERLTRHLNKGVPLPALKSYLTAIRRWVPDELVIQINDSDVLKPDGHKFEAPGFIRDGSKSTNTKNVYEKAIMWQRPAYWQITIIRSAFSLRSILPEKKSSHPLTTSPSPPWNVAWLCSEKPLSSWSEDTMTLFLFLSSCGLSPCQKPFYLLFFPASCKISSFFSFFGSISCRYYLIEKLVLCTLRYFVRILHFRNKGNHAFNFSANPT